MKKIMTCLLALAVCVGLILTREKEPNYILTAVEVRDITEKIEAVGTVSYAKTYAVTSQITGTISRVFVEEGEKVAKGQAIAEMEMLPEYAGQLLGGLQDVEMTAAQIQEESAAMRTIKAPADGILLSLPIYSGMQATPTVPLGSIVSEEMQVQALVPESLKEDISIGQKARLLRGGRTYEAEIAKIEPSTDASSQYVVTLQAKGLKALSAGMKVDVEIVLSECSAPSVPLQAIAADGTIQCKTENGVAAVRVRTGLCNETYAQLLEGPPLGTEVVLGEG